MWFCQDCVNGEYLYTWKELIKAIRGVLIAAVALESEVLVKQLLRQLIR